jgi:hypothetical protein
MLSTLAFFENLLELFAYYDIPISLYFKSGS